MIIPILHDQNEGKLRHGEVLKEIAKKVDSGSISPLIHKQIYSFEKLVKLINFSKRKCRWKSNSKRFRLIFVGETQKLMPDNAKEKATFIVSGVTHSYNQTNALNSIELTINEGECVAIVGPSGGGKTTLLNILNSNIKPSTGKVIIQGKDSTNYTPRELKSVRSKFLSSLKT